MLDKAQLFKFTKPLLTLLLSKTVIFLSILVFIVANHQIGFFSNNPVVSHCDNYISSKISQYQNKIQSVLFLMAFVGTVASGIEASYFTIFYLKIRKRQSSQLQSKRRFSQNNLKFHFIFTFVQSMCLINIFSRSIERLKQQSLCSIQGLSNSIVLAILSTLILCVLVTIYFILFRLWALIKKKILTLEEFKLYSDQMTLKQNLFFNKNGYIQDLFKMQKCQTPSNSLKGKVIKNFPSGFKKNQFLSTREILHRLRGGNETSVTNEQIKINIVNKKDDQSSFDQFENTPNQATLDSKRTLNDKQSSGQNEQNKMTLLQVHPKKLQLSPNEDNFQSIQTTLNVIQLSVNSLKENLKSQDQSSSQDNSLKKKTKQSHKSRILFKKKKDPSDETPNQIQTIKVIKKDKKVSTQLKEEEQLKHKFNLTPNFDGRKHNQGTKNYQNIDQNGHYYFVDVEKIKKRTKFLASNNIRNGQDSDNVDPNVLYSKNEWNPKQKRAGKKHEKNVHEYLRNLSRIRKQETLCEEENDSSSNSFEERQLSSQMSDSSHQDQKQIHLDPQSLDNQNSHSPLQSKRKKREIKQKQPQLYLYLKKKKNFRVQHKLKLFEVQDDVEDEQSSSSENSPQVLQQEKNQINNFQNYNNPPIRKKSIEKPKAEEKVHLKNRELETSEARMLRFIRKKYIELDHSKKSQRQKPHVLFQHQQMNSSNKEVKQDLDEQNH